MKLESSFDALTLDHTWTLTINYRDAVQISLKDLIPEQNEESISTKLQRLAQITERVEEIHAHSQRKLGL